MSDIEEWLSEHADDLATISRGREVGAGMVHLLAVLILGGLDDQQILAELRTHLVLHDSGQDPLREVPEVMQQIRELAAA